MLTTIPYLLLSVFLSAGRNIVSKRTATVATKRAQFFFSQTILFGSATLLLLFFSLHAFEAIHKHTLLYGLIYGILLILSQWMFTIALRKGNTSICTVIYSLGFILPTLSGAVFWKEDFTVTNFIGLIIALIVIMLTVRKNKNDTCPPKAYIPFVLIAMISSGGLGILQKVQQASPAAEQKSLFLLIAFAFAFICSLTAFLLCPKDNTRYTDIILSPTLTGICFGGANMCNTILAGRMKSAVFFPVQNISTILLTTVLGLIIFKEKITAKNIAIVVLGIITIVIFRL